MSNPRAEAEQHLKYIMAIRRVVGVPEGMMLMDRIVSLLDKPSSPIVLTELCEVSYNNANHTKGLRWEAMLPDPANRAAMKRGNLDDRRVVSVYDSLFDQGQVNPLLVCHNDHDEYTVVIGHQRLASMRALKWTHCKVVVIAGREDITATIDLHYIKYVFDEGENKYVLAH